MYTLPIQTTATNIDDLTFFQKKHADDADDYDFRRFIKKNNTDYQTNKIRVYPSKSVLSVCKNTFETVPLLKNRWIYFVFLSTCTTFAQYNNYS